MIIVVGAFPPPVHGMAMVNAAVRDRLRSAGVEVRVLNVAADSLDRSKLARLSRLPRIFRALWCLVTMRSTTPAVLYISVSGGWGQVYELVVLLVAQRLGMRCVLHHHSFSYLQCRRLLTAWLVRMAGQHATHVSLSDGMRQRLQALYTVRGQTLAMSNAVLLLGKAVATKPRRNRGTPLTVGFLSNLSGEKGVFVFLDVMQRAEEAGLDCMGKLAGPFKDSSVETAVRRRLAELQNVDYVGAVYAEDKRAFYASLDVFLFPTRYTNEAEPLVVLEAMQQSVPVIAYGRGAIPERVDESCGLVVPPGADFVAPALALLARWAASPSDLASARAAARQRYEDLHARGTATWRVLEAILAGREGVGEPVDGEVQAQAGDGAK